MHCDCRRSAESLGRIVVSGDLSPFNMIHCLQTTRNNSSDGRAGERALICLLVPSQPHVMMGAKCCILGQGHTVSNFKLVSS